MISKEVFETLKMKFATYSSWAIWSPPYNNVRKNCDDLSRLESDEILSVLHNNFVFIGLNASEGHDVISKDWSQFHSADPKKSWDFRMREATYQTHFEGSYVTDFCKGINMTNSNDFMKYLSVYTTYFTLPKWFYLKSNHIKFKHFVFNKKENSRIYFIIHMLAILILFSLSSLELNGVSLYLMPLFFIQLLFFGGGHEELGWWGVLQPILDKKYSYWQSNLIVGSIWGIWHLPLWFIVGESHQGFPFILFFIYTLFLSFVLGLLYRQTKSVGYCILFHAFANLLNLYFVLKINVIFIAYLIYTILASNIISKETTF